MGSWRALFFSPTMYADETHPRLIIIAGEPWRPRQSSDWALGVPKVTGLPRHALKVVARLDLTPAHASQ